MEYKYIFSAAFTTLSVYIADKYYGTRKFSASFYFGLLFLLLLTGFLFGETKLHASEPSFIDNLNCEMNMALDFDKNMPAEKAQRIQYLAKMAGYHYAKGDEFLDYLTNSETLSLCPNANFTAAMVESALLGAVFPASKATAIGMLIPVAKEALCACASVQAKVTTTMHQIKFHFEMSSFYHKAYEEESKTLNQDDIRQILSQPSSGKQTTSKQKKSKISKKEQRRRANKP